jgi:hypothetical protein
MAFGTSSITYHPHPSATSPHRFKTSSHTLLHEFSPPLHRRSLTVFQVSERLSKRRRCLPSKTVVLPLSRLVTIILWLSLVRACVYLGVKTGLDSWGSATTLSLGRQFSRGTPHSLPSLPLDVVTKQVPLVYQMNETNMATSDRSLPRGGLYSVSRLQVGIRVRWWLT